MFRAINLLNALRAAWAVRQLGALGAARRGGPARHGWQTTVSWRLASSTWALSKLVKQMVRSSQARCPAEARAAVAATPAGLGTCPGACSSLWAPLPFPASARPGGLLPWPRFLSWA